MREAHVGTTLFCGKLLQQETRCTASESLHAHSCSRALTLHLCLKREESDPPDVAEAEVEGAELRDEAAGDGLDDAQLDVSKEAARERA
eukprot:5117127-Pleurochrysis_carterae.AAC.1